uniref:Spectrin repeat containing, nuclear envelope family member 3 n=1 Tax=Poecilia reticulata TaxID=8081 RepID=A0A3P9P8Z1_POERE
ILAHMTKSLDTLMATEEKTLLHIEGVADAVRTNTSPAGAEAVQEEAEELRLGWQRLRQGLCEAEEGLHCSLDSHSQYVTRCQRLGEDIGRIREMLQDLDQELVDTQESKSCTETTEEQMEGQWRKYSVGSSSYNDLYLFYVFNYLICLDEISQESISEVISLLRRFLQGLLQNSAELQERLSLLQVKGDLLDSVFGTESSDDLQGELSAAVRTRELLHNQLLERKNRLEVPEPTWMGGEGDEWVTRVLVLVLAKTVKVRDCDDIVSDHECFHGDLLNMEKWIMVMRQKLDSRVEMVLPDENSSLLHVSPQKLLGEFPEKEVHLQQIEAQGGKVLRRTSTDGQVHIRKDMERSSGSDPGCVWLLQGRRGLNQINWSEFEAWLSRENEVLMKITRTSKSSLSALISRLPEGQQMFQLLLQQTQSRQGEDESLEDLRYRWTLYKSKLKEVENSLIMTKPGLKERKELELMKCGLLYRICRLALLLWLLFLALLLLAFLLPLMDDGNSCSLSNNFARSFNLMLRYDGPPPT